jgi:hypothetical protein
LGKLLDNCVPLLIVTASGRSPPDGAARDGPPVGPGGDPLLWLFWVGLLRIHL